MTHQVVAVLSGLLLWGAEAVASPQAPAATAPGCSGAVPLRFVHGLPVATVDVNGVDVELMLDLGGFDTVSLGTAALKDVAPRYTGNKRSFRNAHGQKLSAREYELARVTIGPHVVEDVRGLEAVRTPEWAPPVDAGSVGLGLLRRFNLTFDYTGARLRLDDEGCPAAEGPDSSSWQVTRMSSQKDGVRISVVIDGRKTSLVLDSGASYSTLRPRATGQGTHVRNRRGDFYRPARMDVAGTEMRPVEFYVVDLPGPGTDGILGCNFFAENEVRIDFRAETVAFRPTPPPSLHPCPSPVEDDAS